MLSLFLLSCENTNYDKYTSDKEFFKDSNDLEKKFISQYNYDFNYMASENFKINNQLTGFNVYHKSLPIPSVLKLYNPNNLNEFKIVRNIKINSNLKELELSTSIVDFLSLKSDVYIEYLKNESENLKSVELSKEKSVVSIDSFNITAEEILDRPSIVSKKMQINTEKLKKNENSNGGIFIFISNYKNYEEAKLKTNKIKNLKLTISSESDSFQVLAGPFTTYDVDETLSFLLNNGFINAKIHR